MNVTVTEAWISCSPGATGTAADIARRGAISERGDAAPASCTATTRPTFRAAAAGPLPHLLVERATEAREVAHSHPHLVGHLVAGDLGGLPVSALAAERRHADVRGLDVAGGDAEGAAGARHQSEPIMNRSSSSSLARSRVIRKWSRFR